MVLNRVIVEVCFLVTFDLTFLLFLTAFQDDTDGRSGKKAIDFDMKDEFWIRNAAKPFPNVAADVDNQLSAYKAEYARIRPGSDSALDSTEGTGITDATASLKMALSAMPALTEQKRIIDLHMSAATGILKEMKRRQLDIIFNLEEAIPKIVGSFSIPGKDPSLIRIIEQNRTAGRGQ